MLKFRELRADEIECRVKQTIQSGNIVLLYKTARTDMDILDETVGPENWYKTYREIKGNLYCTVYIRIDGEWIGKEDCGIESRADDEGNEKKGEASDAFKRAMVLFGPGRSLYSAPFILIPCETEQINGKWRPKKNHYYEVSEIEYKDGKITKLVISERGKIVYVYPATAVPAADTEMKKQTDPESRKAENKALILALAKGDEVRVNAYTMKRYGRTLDELTGAELAETKLSISKQIGE